MTAYAARPQLAGPSWPSVALARCGALLRAARGDLATADAEIRKAVEDAASIGMPFEEARALFISGEIHRRARRRQRAQDALARAERLFAELGAAVWAARCREELARAGAPSRTADEPDTLTATEGRVAELAALGYTTREIAATLFASIRTVETHLQNVYRKLGVRSRVELTRLLGEAGDKDKNSR
jgi:DNA-binding NarL/FixJ family response regulator